MLASNHLSKQFGRIATLLTRPSHTAALFSSRKLAFQHCRGFCTKINNTVSQPVVQKQPTEQKQEEDGSEKAYQVKADGLKINVEVDGNTFSYESRCLAIWPCINNYYYLS